MQWRALPNKYLNASRVLFQGACVNAVIIRHHQVDSAQAQAPHVQLKKQLRFLVKVYQWRGAQMPEGNAASPPGADVRSFMEAQVDK